MRTIRHLIGIWAIVMISSVTLQAQDVAKQARPERKRPTVEQMQERQRNRIVKELALDDQTSAKFAAVYQQYQQEMRALFPARTAKAQSTDAEVEKAMKERFARERKTLDIREKYYGEFRKILSPKQVQKVYSLERRRGEQMRQHNGRRPGMKQQVPSGRKSAPQARKA